MAKKKKKKDRKKHRPPTMARSNLPRRFEEQYAIASDLLDRRRYTEARDLLEEIDRRFPRHFGVLTELANAYFHLKDFPHHQLVCERAAALAPDNADLALMLAGAYLANYHPFLALRAFRRFLERWPNHSNAAQARKTVADLEAHKEELLADLHLSGPDAEEVAALHDETQSLLARGEFPRARQVAEQLLQRQPQFAAAFNNLGEAWFRKGNTEQAIVAARRVLEFAPENIHALSNLVRYLALSGRAAEARPYAERLKAAPAIGSDPWTKKAEALTCLGDDAGVVEVLRQAEAAAARQATEALLYHLAAAAEARLGHDADARRLWTKALQVQPGFDLAKENLEDLRKPVGERHAPWPFPFTHWLTERTAKELAANLGPAGDRKKAGAETAAVRRFLQAHPEVAARVPLMLDRGDPTGRALALRLALLADTPDMQAALRDFALSQRGPDEQRMEAAQVASQAGLIPRDSVRMWIKGEWGEMLLMGFELHGEPSGKLQLMAQKLLKEGMEALYREEDDTAERLFKEALELEPDSPSLLNNLAAAYEAQGRVKESEEITRQIFERHPDYLFARCNVAMMHAHKGETGKAKELLEPLMQRRRMHFSEFAALCSAWIELLLAEGNRKGAQAWLNMWEQTYPDHPHLEDFRQRVAGPGWLRWLKGKQ